MQSEKIDSKAAAKVIASCAPILKAAGLYSQTYTAEQMFVLETEIMNDPEVLDREGSLRSAPGGCEKYSIMNDDRPSPLIDALNAMTDKELKELKARVKARMAKR